VAWSEKERRRPVRGEGASGGKAKERRRVQTGPLPPGIATGLGEGVRSRILCVGIDEARVLSAAPSTAASFSSSSTTLRFHSGGMRSRKSEWAMTAVRRRSRRGGRGGRGWEGEEWESVEEGGRLPRKWRCRGERKGEAEAEGGAEGPEEAADIGDALIHAAVGDSTRGDGDLCILLFHPSSMEALLLIPGDQPSPWPGPGETEEGSAPDSGDGCRPKGEAGRAGGPSAEEWDGNSTISTQLLWGEERGRWGGPAAPLWLAPLKLPLRSGDRQGEGSGDGVTGKFNAMRSTRELMGASAFRRWVRRRV
jgi:hypothetical protein